MQGSQFRTVPVSMAGIYRTDQCTGTSIPLVSYRKKYQPYQPRTGEIRLFRPVKMFWIGTNEKKKEKEKEEEDEKK